MNLPGYCSWYHSTRVMHRHASAGSQLQQCLSHAVPILRVIEIIVRHDSLANVTGACFILSPIGGIFTGNFKSLH